MKSAANSRGKIPLFVNVPDALSSSKFVVDPS